MEKEKLKNISNMKIEGIVIDRIYDSISSTLIQEGMKCEEFIINSEKKYVEGERISINQALINYDFIGVMDDEDVLSLPYGNNNKEAGVISINLNNRNIKLLGGENNAYKADYIQTSYVISSNMVERTPSSIYLYKEFQGNVNISNIHNERGYIFKYGLRFFVDNLNIKITGKIGKEPFVAIKDYREYNKGFKGSYVNINPVELTREDTLGLDNYRTYRNSYNYKNHGIKNPEVGLNFTSINLNGRIKLPKEKKKINIKIKFEPSLTVADISSIEKYKGNYKIKAFLKYIFIVETKVFLTKKESIGVFAREKELL